MTSDDIQAPLPPRSPYTMGGVIGGERWEQRLPRPQAYTVMGWGRR